MIITQPYRHIVDRRTGPLLRRYEQLPEPQKSLVQLKALVFTACGKTRFLSCVASSGIPGPGGKGWTAQSLSPILAELAEQGLLEEDLACAFPLAHAASADALIAPKVATMLKAIAKAFPEQPFASHSEYDKADGLRRLRLAIYGNDPRAFTERIEYYDRLFQGSFYQTHILTDLFGPTPLSPDWLAGLAPPIQRAVLSARLSYLLIWGGEAPDLPLLLDHYRPLAADPDWRAVAWDILLADILAERLTQAEELLARLDAGAAYQARAFAALLAFLRGRVAESLPLFREAIKLYRREIGKRKPIPGGIDGLFALLALAGQGDPALLPEAEAWLEGAGLSRSSYGEGFLAIEALLQQQQGRSDAAKKLLQRQAYLSPPLSTALTALARYFVEPEALTADGKSLGVLFERVKDSLPLVAGLVAELLARTQTEAACESFLSRPGREVAVRFTELIHVKQPWEYALERLANFLAPDQAAPDAAKAKGRRLVWLVDPDSLEVQALEQSARARNGWTAGRAVAMKRLYERDPRLDYLTDHDRRALGTLRRDLMGWYNDLTYSFVVEKTIPALIGHPLVFDARNPGQRLELVSYPVELVVRERRNGYHLALSHDSDVATIFLEEETPGRYQVVEFSERMVAVRRMLGGSKGLIVPKAGRDRVVALIRRADPALPIRAEIADIDLPSIEGDATPVLQLTPVGEGLAVTLAVRPFGPEGPDFAPGKGGQSVLAVIGGERKRANRDFERERAAAAALTAAIPALAAAGPDCRDWVIEDLEEILEFLEQVKGYPDPVALEWLQEEKFRLTAPVGAAHSSLKVRESRDWFVVEGQVHVAEDMVVDMRDLLKRLDRAVGRFVPLDDGRFIALTAEFKRQLDRFNALSEAEGPGRRLPRLGAPAVRDFVEQAGQISTDRAWLDLLDRIDKAEAHEPRLPPTLQAELRDYQLEGFRWLSCLARWGAGACLADDMGLGKTVQALAVMLEQASKGPIIVVAPTSVCHNWEDEILRFAPTLTAHALSRAADREALVAGLGPMDVLVASYGLLVQDEKLLAGIDWAMLVLDEAQALKNRETRRAQAAARLRAGFRLALTGTPIENSLDELWSLFNLINPGLLGTREAFRRRYALPIERDGDPAVRHALKSLVAPFLLRRTKAAVLSELPPRIEQTLFIEPDAEERALYEALRRRAVEHLQGLDKDAAKAGERRIHILAEIGKLRQACCHPGLIDPESRLPGAKLRQLLELVEELRQNRHRALVFSQFVGFLDIVRRALDEAGISYHYLDGGTPPRERERRVKAFQAGEGDLFLISLRAGGTGLNLTAADYVIHLDPWWNPAVEDQASDRAHRLGQTRPVTIYRLIMEDTIEEGVLDLHRTKRDLASELLAGSEVGGRLSEAELMTLIRG